VRLFLNGAIKIVHADAPWPHYTKGTVISENMPWLGNLYVAEIFGNWTFRPFVSSPHGRFAHKTFRPMVVFNVS